MKQIAPECFVFFSKGKCRFGIPESPEEQKNKNETKKKQERNKYKAVWCNLYLFCLLFFLFFLCLFNYFLVSSKMKHSAS